MSSIRVTVAILALSCSLMAFRPAHAQERLECPERGPCQLALGQARIDGRHARLFGNQVLVGSAERHGWEPVDLAREAGSGPGQPEVYTITYISSTRGETDVCKVLAQNFRSPEAADAELIRWFEDPINIPKAASPRRSSADGTMIAVFQGLKEDTRETLVLYSQYGIFVLRFCIVTLGSDGFGDTNEGILLETRDNQLQVNIYPS